MEGKAVVSFSDLNAWKEGHKLALSVYELTKLFPPTEVFGLTSQMRRSSISVTSNIAEGFSRVSRKDKAQFYRVALGSITELQNQLILSKDLGYALHGRFDELYTLTIVVHKLVNGLIKYFRSRPTSRFP